MSAPGAEEPHTGAADPGVASFTDATLVGRTQDGDVDSFATLVRRYQVPVLRLATRMLGNRADAEDAVQDSFILVWRQLPTLTDPDRFRSWLYRIVTRTCLSAARTRARRQTAPVDGAELEATRSEAPLTAGQEPPTPERAAESAALGAELADALAALPQDQRLCWDLRELHGLSYDEIAYVTHSTVPTVRGRIARARQNLVKGMRSWA